MAERTREHRGNLGVRAAEVNYEKSKSTFVYEDVRIVKDLAKLGTGGFIGDVYLFVTLTGQRDVKSVQRQKKKK